MLMLMLILMLMLMLMLVLQVFVSMGTSLGIGGRARVSREGVNCTISGSYVHPHARPRTSRDTLPLPQLGRPAAHGFTASDLSQSVSLY